MLEGFHVDEEKMELFFILWKKGYIWPKNGKLRSDGKIELWKSAIERMSENAKKELDK